MSLANKLLALNWMHLYGRYTAALMFKNAGVPVWIAARLLNPIK